MGICGCGKDLCGAVYPVSVCSQQVATIFMFGQTGSGKSHTMTGLMHRTVQDLFAAGSESDPFRCILAVPTLLRPVTTVLLVRGLRTSIGAYRARAIQSLQRFKRMQLFKGLIPNPCGGGFWIYGKVLERRNNAFRMCAGKAGSLPLKSLARICGTCSEMDATSSRRV